MADLELGAGDGFNRDLGGQDGALTFAEAFTSHSSVLLIFNSNSFLTQFSFSFKLVLPQYKFSSIRCLLSSTLALISNLMEFDLILF